VHGIAQHFVHNGGREPISASEEVSRVSGAHKREFPKLRQGRLSGFSTRQLSQSRQGDQLLSMRFVAGTINAKCGFIAGHG